MLLGLWACVCWYFPRVVHLLVLSVAVALVLSAYVSVLYWVRVSATFRESILLLGLFGVGVLIGRLSGGYVGRYERSRI